MSNYIDADKLIAEIERYKNTAINAYNPLKEDADFWLGKVVTCEDLKSIIASLQQEQPETEMKSPFTGGKVAILSREEEVTFRVEEVKITRKYYRCKDTGREFTDSKLDDDMMWAVFRAYCEKKGMTSFTDIILKQQQPEVDLEDNFLFDEVLNVFDSFKRLPPRDKETLDFLINLAHHFCELGETRVTGRASVIECEYKHQPFKVAQ